jgi:hypothetical protein
MENIITELSPEEQITITQLRRVYVGVTSHATRLLVSEQPVHWPRLLHAQMKTLGSQLLAL